MDIRQYANQKLNEYRQARRQCLDDANANDGAAQAMEELIHELDEEEKNAVASGVNTEG